MNENSGKVALAPERDTNDEISNRQQLQDGMIELLQKVTSRSLNVEMVEKGAFI